MVGDHYGEKWRKLIPDPAERPDPIQPFILHLPVTRDEFNLLKREVEDLRELLKKAIEYDKRTGQPDCHDEGKWAIIRAVAKAVGVDIDAVLATAVEKPEAPR